MDTPFEAVVQAAGYETAYTSRGRGAPVVLVAATPRDRQRLAALLVGEERVIEPVPPQFEDTGAEASDGGERLGQWLLGFIEGLGIHAPRVFLAATFAHTTPAISAMLARVEAVVAVAAWPEGED